MKELQTVIERKPIEWKNQVVITTALLARFYEANEQQIQQNFNNYKDNFVDGKHYYLLQGEELREFKRYFDNIEEALGVSKFAPKLYLWTERGANRHCKILDTDKAWEQFDNLEETYFNKKQEVINFELLDPSTKLMNLLVRQISRNEIEQKRLAKEVEEVKQTQVAIEQKQEALADIFQKTTDTEDFQTWAKNCISQIAESPKFDKKQGRSKNYSLAYAESYERLKQKRNCRLDERVQKAVGRAISEKPDIKKSELDKISKIYIIANDKDLKPAYELVIKEMMIFYCVKRTLQDGKGCCNDNSSTRKEI